MLQDIRQPGSPAERRPGDDALRGCAIRILGRFAVTVDGQEVPPRAFGGRLVRQLVRLLGTRRGVHVSKDVLADALWGDHPPVDPAGNLETLVSRARRALGYPSLILTLPGGYAFSEDNRCRVDAEEFTTRAEAGRSELGAHRYGKALEALRSALDLWSGDPLMEDAYAEWAQDYRRDLCRTHLRALEGAAAAALAVGAPALAADFAQQAVAVDPLSEAGHLLLVQALAASSDTAGALAAFEDLRRRLAEELGLDPSPQALQLRARILRGDTSALRPHEIGVPPPELAFVGRGAELEAALSAGRHPGFRALLVQGASGAGKSRLLLEAAARARVPALLARACVPGRDEPWQLVSSLLRQALTVAPSASASLTEHEAWALGEIVPGLAAAEPTDAGWIDPSARRSLITEGAMRIIATAAGGGSLVLIDDLQWADSTSLAFLQALPWRVEGLGLVVAFRAEDVPEEGPVASFLSSMGEAGAARLLVLGVLPGEGIEELIADEGVVRVIVEETWALPIVVCEVIHAMSANRDFFVDEAGRWGLRPGIDPAIARDAARAGALGAIRGRMEQLAPGRLELVAMLGLLEREVPARLLAVARGREETPILDALHALSRAGLVQLGERGWTIKHRLVAEAAFDALAQEDRARLHAMLALALRQEGTDPSELGAHLAGAGDPEAAAGAYLQAAQQRLDQIANDEAAALASTGLGLLPSAPLRGHLVAVRAEARRRAGDLSGARNDFQEALSALGPGAVRVRVLGQMALLEARVEDPVRGEELAALAIADAGADPGARAEALAVGAIVALSAGQLSRARHRADEALALLEQGGNVVAAARIFYCRAMAELLEGHIREAVGVFGNARSWFVGPGESLRLWNPQATRGHARALMGEAEDGLTEIDEALVWARRVRHPQAESECLWHRGEALIVLGRIREAIEAATQALEIARTLAHHEWTAASLLAIGLGWDAAGDLEAAEEALREAMAVAERSPLFTSWAGARLARTLVHARDLRGAEALIQEALAGGVPLVAYEARLARAELAAAREEDCARVMAHEAMQLAMRGGHLVSVPRLRELALA